MTVFTSPTVLVYARPTKEKIPLGFLSDRAAAGATVPGFVYSLAKASPVQADALRRQIPSAAPVRLYSPDIDLLPHSKGRARAIHPFTADLPTIDQSAAKVAGWLQEIVTTQIDLDATAVVTPSLLLDANHGETELRQMLDWAERCRRTPGAETESFLTGLTLHRDWLAKRSKRELLLNQLTDTNHSAFYLVTRWAAPAKSDQQLGEKEPLEGLREVVEVLEEDDREVVLARMGLAGWPFLALGAAAVTASPIPNHIFRDPVTFARKKGAPTIPRIPLYLDRRLLSYVPFERMGAINSVSGAAHCSCSDCARLATGYEDRAAFRHYLGVLCELRDRTVSTSDPRTFALRSVKSAQALIASTPNLGLAARVTSHLSVWEGLLN